MDLKVLKLIRRGQHERIRRATHGQIQLCKSKNVYKYFLYDLINIYKCISKKI